MNSYKKNLDLARDERDDVNVPELERGDVYLAELPFPDDVERTSSHRKHVVILQSDNCSIFKNSPTVAILKLTTKNPTSSYPTDVYVPPDECGHDNGVRIIANQPHTILKKRLIGYRYTLSKSTIKEMDLAIVISTGIVDM